MKTINEQDNGLVVRRCHQQRAEQLAADHDVGANAVADLLALLDARGRGAEPGEAGVMVGKVSDMASALHGRHAARTIQRAARLLLEEGILVRLWPVHSPQPVFELKIPALDDALAEVTEGVMNEDVNANSNHE